MTLKNAPAYIQLAVDIIQILEEHELDNETVLKALSIVTQDFESKTNNTSTSTS
ncbi:DUF2496 domain-containing protein [Thalassotalea psychrophila]|uniref:DUF2496 domain-containing protein n=1 Tax=Thalassotalea psychrophila TaxID=3065647 RepID=A0ABY9TW87_9GAMM|nr:DUF2496 domain-containing protein [Colwelliaceae bacterium SQ149]